jgi:hypothetical protein
VEPGAAAGAVVGSAMPVELFDVQDAATARASATTVSRAADQSDLVTRSS